MKRLKQIFKYTAVISLAFSTLISCEKEEELLSENEILSFVFDDYKAEGQIDQEEAAIRLYVPEGTDKGKLSPTIEVSPKASVDPASGQENNFKNPAIYSVSAENGALNLYTVYVEEVKNNIYSFGFPSLEIQGEIKDDNTIYFILPYGTDRSELVPEISYGENAVISPESGVAQDFSEPVVYTVTAANGDVNTYSVVVDWEEGSSENTLSSLSIPELFADAEIKSNELVISLPHGIDESEYFDLNHLKVEVEYSDLATLDIDPDDFDLLQTKEINVTAQTGEVQTYKLSVNIEAQNPDAVRGVWVTNVASNALVSEKMIDEMVNRVDDLGFNTIYVVTYNKFMTLHPSEVLKNFYAEGQAHYGDDWRGGALPTQFYGETEDNGFDPLQIVIDKAHAKGLKVVAWFEYGFAYRYGAVNTKPYTEGGDWVYNFKPDWFSMDKDGDVAHKNSFYWFNGYKPEVQKFINDLIVEVVEKYDVDGIQGDDRLPAQPNTAGHDPYTKALYKEETGRDVPNEEQESNFTQWRSDKMTDYAVSLHDAVKAADPNCLVMFSPSVYTFSKVNYMQDWPEWINAGVVDHISPQCYRYEEYGLSAYTYLVGQQMEYMGTLKKEQFSPGILIAAGSYIPTDKYLADCIKFNRSKGLEGEVHFYYEALASKSKVFHALYPKRANFPL
ncbi:family 10 glycosylhydrolase [Sediminitomix flava]|uniref:Uncharacterized lipoprotein YddW (UPF0748 family) n=1 Tax=Sediminitomix flava TaxID=379075 RepID=A0A315ZE62_SEDFL|nr:family 10 glycosylhydrolase [Sediminitomix flava]PWJ43821.1 uncharacterized lipoprotein YddW (UPF0748 family) [Sediminitomix flava]